MAARIISPARPRTTPEPQGNKSSLKKISYNNPTQGKTEPGTNGARQEQDVAAGS